MQPPTGDDKAAVTHEKVILTVTKYTKFCSMFLQVAQVTKHTAM